MLLPHCAQLLLLSMLYLTSTTASCLEEKAKELQSTIDQLSQSLHRDPEYRKNPVESIVDHAIRLPSKLRHGLLDLHHDPKTDNVVIAFVDNDKEAKQQYLTFYAPYMQHITQRISISASSDLSQEMVGSFSEDGRFFTWGKKHPLHKPQSIHVYERNLNSRQPIAEYIRQRIAEYINTAVLVDIIICYLAPCVDYGFLKSIPHNPPNNAQQQPAYNVTPHSFAYDHGTRRVICYPQLTNRLLSARIITGKEVTIACQQLESTAICMHSPTVSKNGRYATDQRKECELFCLQADLLTGERSKIRNLSFNDWANNTYQRQLLLALDNQGRHSLHYVVKDCVIHLEGYFYPSWSFEPMLQMCDQNSSISHNCCLYPLEEHAIICTAQ